MSAFNFLHWFGRTITLKTGGQFFGQFFGTGGNWAGEPVTIDTAMQLSAVWKCVRLIASTIASLPLGLVSNDELGKSARGLEDIDTVIRKMPNQENSSMEFWEAIIGAQETAGNGFARKHFRGTGPSREVIALTLLDPWRMSWERRANNEILWRYVNDRRETIELPSDQVFQLKQFSFDGVLGLSTVQYGAQTISGARAADRTANELFAKGMTSSGFLETAQTLNPDDRVRLQKIMDEYRGKAGAGKLMILEGGMKYNPMTLSAQDAQLLLSRSFNIEEICRWFDVPPILCGHSSAGQTNWGTGVEQIILAWLQLGLRNRLVRIQQAIERQLLNADQKTLWTPKYNIDALLQGDSAARIEYLSSAVQNGLMNRDEGRAKLDLPPYEGGEVFTAQVNLAPVSTLGDNPQSEAQALRSAVRRFLGIEDETPKPLQIQHIQDRAPGA